MNQWEYKTKVDPWDEQLTALGKKGWEIAWVSTRESLALPGVVTTTVYLKRLVAHDAHARAWQLSGTEPLEPTP